VGQLRRAPESQRAYGQSALYTFNECILQKIENHAAAVALYYFAYNLIKIHSSLRVTPAMAAGVTDRLVGSVRPRGLVGSLGAGVKKSGVKVP
jgi:hypothetical protein